MRYIVTAIVLSMMYSASVLAAPLAYVISENNNFISIIDLSNNMQTSDINDVGNPVDLATTPDGKFVYVAAEGSVLVVQTSDMKVVDNIDIDVGEENVSIAISPDGKFVYVTHFDMMSMEYVVSVIQTSDNTVVDTVEVQNQPTDIAVTPDSKFVYVVNGGGAIDPIQSPNSTVSVIQTSDHTVIETINVGQDSVEIAIDPNGDFAYVTNVLSNDISKIQISNNMVVDNIKGFTKPLIVEVSPDNELLYVVEESTALVNVYKILDNMVIDTVAGENQTSGFLCVVASPDGDFIYICGSESVLVVPTSDYSKITTINLGADVNDVLGIALVPDQDLLGSEDGGNGSSNSCALAGPETSNSSLLIFLIIPALILIRRFRKI